MKPETERRVRGYVLAFCGGAILATLTCLVLLRQRFPHRPEQPIDSHAVVDRDRREAPQPKAQTFTRIPRTMIASPAPDATELSPSQPEENLKAGLTAETPMEGPGIVRIVERAAASPLTTSSRINSEAGRLSGKVVLLGTQPPEKILPLDPLCAARADQLHGPKTTRLYVVGKDRGLADVVVSLVGVSTSERMARTNLVVQEACSFSPYISAIQAGQPVLVQNNDLVPDIVTIESKQNGNEQHLLKRLGSFSFKLPHPEEFVRLRNDSHFWEFAYITVFDHPFFAVTDKNGEFVISGIPPGRYTVQAQHRKAGRTTQQIAVEANRNTDVQFELSVPGMQTASLQ